MFWGGFALMYVGRTVADRLRTLLVMLLVSLFVSLAIEPAVDWLGRRGWKRGTAAGALLSGITIASIVFLVAIGALVAEQVSNIVNRAPEYLTSIERWVNDTFNASVEFDDLITRLTEQGAPVTDLRVERTQTHQHGRRRALPATRHRAV